MESLEKYLPRIRDIIINLLHGLKRKQQKLRQKQSREGNATPNGEAQLPRNSSVSSVGSANTGLTTLLDQGLNNGFRGEDSSSSSINDAPPRMSSSSSSRQRQPAPRAPSRESMNSDQSTLSSQTMQNLPVLPPYSGNNDENAPPVRPMSGDLTVDAFPPPPPPKQTSNALAALQRGGDLERRASRRYSAYQISKHLGASPNGVPMMPPPQNSPIPNRGQNEARESMRAVQGRDPRHARQNSSRFAKEASPARIPSRISEESSRVPTQEDANRSEDPDTKIPDNKLQETNPNFDGPSATLNGPPSDVLSFPAISSPEEPTKEPEVPPPQQDSATRDGSTYMNQDRQFTPEQCPPLDKDLTIFLQYKTKVKKFVLPNGYKDLSLARIQLAFIEKFSWNTQNNGVELPEIYIQDPVSGVRHELEDLQDIKDRSVLVLNIEVLDEVKRHIDEGLGGIRKIIEGVKVAVDDQQVSIQRVSERQQETAKEMARMAVAPPPPRASYSENARLSATLMSPTKANSSAQLNEIQSLKRDLAVLRQTYSGFQSDIQDSMTKIRTQASQVKAVGVAASAPDISGVSGRLFVNKGKKELQENSDKLVAQVDELQDVIETLRKDVVLRGVRPLPRQLEIVGKDISDATRELKKMQGFLKKNTGPWSEVWEQELRNVCDDREDLTVQEDLVADLQDDLEKATATFTLVEEATKELMKDVKDGTGAIIGTRNLSKGLNHITAADPNIAKEGVLGEVRALQPNHENRLEAIERAEKLRKKELETRQGGEFQKELGNFVEEGRLKKAGGFEEVERARKAKDDRIRREVWERQNGMTQADASYEPEAGEAAEEEPNSVPSTDPLDI